MPTVAPMTVRFSEETRAGVSQLAKLTKRSRSYIINQAVKDYLAKNSAYLQDIDEAVASIESSPTYEAEEVFSWMKSWGTDEEQLFNEAVTPHHKL